MKFDLTNLITNIVDSINIEEKVIIPEELIKQSSIRKLENVIFKGKITKDYDMNLILEGNISGTMTLPDDITLEDTEYEFQNEIEEYIEEVLQINKNSIDILELLWQNILVEIPLRVRNPKNKDLHLEGEGWRLITEEELENKKNCPLSDLSKLLNKEGRE